ncbi:MAG TPA: hypothetical protein VM370_08125 [Candidatus Thermoplasmatota archaeon]|nr:hypothetical protein [Candidatus Thermoplasmatota archaeon]
MTDRAVSSVLGTMLMLAIMATLIPITMMTRQAVSDELQAQREAAERAAFCARNPLVGPPTCVAHGPLPGYTCTTTGADVWVCAPPGAPQGPSPSGSTTPTPIPVLTSPTVPTLGV